MLATSRTLLYSFYFDPNASQFFYTFILLLNAFEFYQCIAQHDRREIAIFQNFRYLAIAAFLWAVDA